tara:strand:- start:344 stop:490 length:147 start_codon:yes stop_codon:yes gene_type:complete
MELFEYITGKAGLMILGLIVISILFYRKYKTQRYFKYIEKQQKNKRSK